MMSLAAMAGMERHLRTTFPIWLGLVVTPATPWKPAADRLGLNRSVCQDAHRLHTLPPLPPGRQFADRNDQVHPADAGNRRPATPDAARRSSNRRPRRPSTRPRKPQGNGHSNVEGAQSLASRFWAKAEELSTRPGSSWPIGCTPLGDLPGCVSPAQIASIHLARAS